jgi:hypothetical protein
MFISEELREAKIFACLDEAECARLAHTIADVRLKPGEWLFREAGNREQRVLDLYTRKKANTALELTYL